MPQNTQETSVETTDEMWQQKKELEDETWLSPQESHIVALRSELNKYEISEHLGISVGQYESIWYGRISDKLDRSHQTIDLLHGPYWLDAVDEADVDAFGLVGCTGPGCENDVNTATENPTFENYYTKMVNTHADGRQISNTVELVFCSQNCLMEYDTTL